MEGLINEGTDYEDWISDASTWLGLGDKCAMHHMYSLATDFYALGMMKDPDAFRKPMLWLRFAKACRRCGRKADALLAVKVGCMLHAACCILSVCVCVCMCVCVCVVCVCVCVCMCVCVCVCVCVCE
jgi:hypothetical protein